MSKPRPGRYPGRKSRPQPLSPKGRPASKAAPEQGIDVPGRPREPARERFFRPPAASQASNGVGSTKRSRTLRVMREMLLS